MYDNGGSAEDGEVPRFPICNGATDTLDEYIVRDKHNATIFGVFKKDDEPNTPFEDIPKSSQNSTYYNTIQFVGLIQIIGDKVKILRQLAYSQHNIKLSRRGVLI